MRSVLELVLHAHLRAYGDAEKALRLYRLFAGI